MNNYKSSIAFALITILASRLCCIIPFIAIVSGMAGGATMFSFLEPYKPFLFLTSASILAFGFYQEYKSKNMEKMRPCCQANTRKKSKRNRKFLWSMTLISLLLFTFPLYSQYFIKSNLNHTSVNSNNIKTIHIAIEGMSCQGCANNIMLQLSQTNGIMTDTVFFNNNLATITFDNAEITPQQIIDKINEIGFISQLSSH